MATKPIKSVFTTGFSTMQCLGQERGTLKIVTFSSLVTDELNRMGFRARHGKPEEYDDEDFIFIGINSPKSFTTRHSYDCMQMWEWCLDTKMPFVPYFDDWRFFTHMSQLWGLREGNGNKPYDRKKAQILNHHTKLGVFDDAVVEKFIRWFNFGTYHFAWLAADYGNPTLLRKYVKNKNSIPFDLNPTPYMTPYSTVDSGFETKKEQWVIGSLYNLEDYIAELGVKWPVLDFGSRKSSMGRVTEAELQLWLNKSWGNIAVPQPHSGGGWWRDRYLMSANANSIIVGDMKAAQYMGPEYCIKPEDVELMNPKERWELAMGQKERYQKINPTVEEGREQMIKMLSLGQPNLEKALEFVRSR